MSMLKLTINVNLPQELIVISCCVLSFLQLKMANLNNLVGFVLIVTTRYKETRVEGATITLFAPR